MILCLIIICLLAFFLGVLFGRFFKDLFLSPKEKLQRAQTEKLKQEFRNFLDYDGSEQLEI